MKGHGELSLPRSTGTWISAGPPRAMARATAASSAASVSARSAAIPKLCASARKSGLRSSDPM